MSFLVPKTEVPNSLADNTPGRSATRSPKQVVPLIIGRGRAVVQMVTPVLHWHFRTSKSSQSAFCSGFGVVCLGPVDEFVRIIVNEKGYTGIFKFRADYPGTAYVDHVISNETPEKFRLFWGLEDNANYSAYINSLVRDPAHPMYGKAHPAYRGVVGFGFQDLYAGDSTNGKTPPVPKIELELYRRSPTGFSFGYAAHGTHPIGIVKDILTLKRGGLKLPGGYFDDAHWTAQMQAIMDTGIAGIAGADLFTSFVFAEPKEASEQVADVLAYIDGFLLERNGQLRIGYSPNDGTTINPAGLTVISQHHLAGDYEDDPGVLDGLPSQIIVTGLEWGSDPPLSEASETAQVPFVERFLGEQRPPLTYNRPGYTTRAQLKSAATMLAAIVSNPDYQATVPILAQYAVQPDGVTPLRPGDLFVLNIDQVGGINLVVRILSREKDSPTATTYRVMRERGTFPRPFEPVLDPRVSTTPPVPADLARYVVKELPPALAVLPAVTALVERPSNGVSSFELHFAPTNSWPGQVIATLDRWCVAAVLRTTLAATTGDVTISVDTVGTDWSYLRSQSALEQLDDTLVCVHGNEWFSVGTITPTGGGAYSITLKRVRLDSDVQTHAIGDLFFFCYRALLPEVGHASFADLYVSGAYDATTATKWFKLRPQSNGGQGNLTAAFSLTIQEPDVTLDDPSLFYTFIFKRNPTVPATPTGDTPAGWSDGPPAGTDPLWMSRGVKHTDTGVLEGTWSDPVRLDGAHGADVYTLVLRGDCVNLGGGTVGKSGGSAAWDSDAYSLESFVNGAFLSFRASQTNAHLMIALNTDPTTDEDYTSLDYAWLCDGSGVAWVYAAAGYPFSTAYATTDVFSITYDGLNVRWLINGVVKYTLAVAANLKLCLDSSFNTPGGQVNSLKFGPQGAAGAAGGQSASVFIYKRSASAPSLPSASTTYTFATGGLSGLNNGWTQAVPSGTDPLYVSVATAFGTGATDAIAAAEWAAAEILAQNGDDGDDGADGADGVDGVDGAKTAVVYIFKRSASAPALPSASTTYTFATGGLSGLNNGWTQAVPSGTDPLYVSVATAFGTGATDAIAAAEWAAAIVLAQNGEDGLSLEVEYSVNGSTSWHGTFTTGDLYMRQRLGSGGTWSAAMKIIGEDGTHGSDGATVLGTVGGSSGCTGGIGPTSGSAPISLTVTMPGTPKIVTWSGSIINTSGGSITVTGHIYRDGGSIASTVDFVLASGQSAQVSLTSVDTPSAGSHTYTLYGVDTSGNFALAGQLIVS